MTATAKKPTKASEAAREKEEARQRLRQLLPPGSTVWGRVAHVSSTGMSRVIQLEIPTQDERTGALSISDITGLVARALGERITDRPQWGLKVGGCGMDMVFHVIHSLSYALHGFGPRGDTGESTDSPEQVAARNGPMAPGVPGAPGVGSPTKDGEGCRRPGYTLQQGRA